MAASGEVPMAAVTSSPRRAATVCSLSARVTTPAHQTLRYIGRSSTNAQHNQPDCCS